MLRLLLKRSGRSSSIALRGRNGTSIARTSPMLRGGSRLNAESKFRFKTLGFYLEPEIVTFEPHRMLVWSAKGPAGTSGSHAWYIEPRPRGCRVITEESQIGLLLYFLRTRTRDRLLTSHEEWLRSLKERAEALEAAQRDGIV